MQVLIVPLVCLWCGMAAASQQSDPRQMDSRQMEKLFGSTLTYTIPVSPSVLATVVTRNDDLVLMILWRGGLKWHAALPRQTSGGKQGAGWSGAVAYGATSLTYSYQPGPGQFVVNGRTNRVPGGSNVFLVDGVDQPDAALTVTGIVMDAKGANTDWQKGSLAPLFARSTAVVSFLECDRWPRHVGSAEPCAQLQK